MEIQLAVRCVIGVDYPLPMVNHAEISQINTERMKQIYHQISLKPGPLNKYVRRRQRHMMEMTESVSRHGQSLFGVTRELCCNADLFTVIMYGSRDPQSIQNLTSARGIPLQASNWQMSLQQPKRNHSSSESDQDHKVVRGDTRHMMLHNQ